VSDTDDADSRRNTSVEAAVTATLERIDAFAAGAELRPITAQLRAACDSLLDEQSASARTAGLFLAFYWLHDTKWNGDEVPVGIRGKYGDKLLSEGLTERSVTRHNAITAFAENLGWKGNVRRFKLSRDERLKDFVAALKRSGPRGRQRAADYLAQKYAESRVVEKPLPPVGADVLTFVRAKVLFYGLLALHSEGHVQQFLIAALLYEYRRRHSVEVRTHHPHAADLYDDTAGDIEEYRDDELVRAYEVTGRDDWMNRISNFKRKMDRFHLRKYVIIASGINSDSEWSVPATMALNLEKHGRDIAVVDIADVVNFLAAELTAVELRGAVNKAYEYLSAKKLSGREDFKAAYRNVVRLWLDEAATRADEQEADVDPHTAEQ
jgi:hypothetical protein